jgi:hypothetical protein
MIGRLAEGRALLSEIMAIGQQRGELRTDLAAAELGRIFQQSLFGAFFLWTMHPPAPLELWIEQTFGVFWSGIAAQRG